MNTKKRDILIFLKKNRIQFIQDPSNQDRKYTRNRLRHDILPALLKNINPAADEALASLSEIAHDVNEWLQVSVDKAFASCVQRKGSNINVDILKFKKYPAAVQSGILMKIFDLRKETNGHWTYEHVRSLLDLCENEDKSKYVMLPDKHKAFLTQSSKLRIQSH